MDLIYVSEHILQAICKHFADRNLAPFPKLLQTAAFALKYGAYSQTQSRLLLGAGQRSWKTNPIQVVGEVRCMCAGSGLLGLPRSTRFRMWKGPYLTPQESCQSTAAVRLLLGRGSPDRGLRGINHSVGPFPRFFFQDAFSITCEENVRQTAVQCASPALKDPRPLLRLSGKVKSSLFLDAEHL